MSTGTADIGRTLTAAKKQLASGDPQGAIHAIAPLEHQDLSAQDRVECLYLKAVALRYSKALSAAQQALDELLSLAPQHSRALQEQGHLLLALDERRDAAQAFYRATLLNPALVASWKALDTLYQGVGDDSTRRHVKENLRFWSRLPKPLVGAADLLFSGELASADKVCRHFLLQNKHHVDGLYILGLIDIQANVYDEAEFVLESCCELAPQHWRARAEYAGILNRTGKYHKALKQADNLLESEPDNLNYQVLKGIALVGVGEVELGIQQFTEILDIEPERSSLWLQLGHAFKTVGQLDEAVNAYRNALAYRHDYGDAYWSLANTKAYRFSADELAKMAALIDDQSVLSEDCIHLAFALGKGLEDSGEAERGFTYYRKGNEVKYAGCQYSPELFSHQVDRQIAFFNPSFWDAMGEVGSDDPAPIFIVGLPRAGSTLLEQILSSHSAVDATHELHDILSLVRRLRKGGEYPQMLASLSPDYFERFGRQFIDQTRVYRQSGTFFVDKMPNNFLHVGLIKLILPNAKVIDARRDPMDCCYSGYKQLFAEGQDFSYDLKAIGRYYRDYERMMSHWDEVLPDFVLRVQHEDVLADTEQQVRRILAFCGLDFEPDCLAFYRTQRPVHTPSAAQVREPINRKGVGRWRNVEKHLQPLIEALSGD